MSEKTVWFGEHKAIQGIQIQHNPDGSAKLGVTAWVPLGTDPPRYRSIICAIDITPEQLRAIGAATNEKDEGNGQKRSSGTVETESAGLVGNLAEKPGNGDLGSGNS